MNKYFHNLVLGVSVLPALLVMPAVAVDITEEMNLNSEYSDGVLSERINSIYGHTGIWTVENITINTPGSRAIQAWYENSKVYLGDDDTQNVKISAANEIGIIAGVNSYIGLKGKNIEINGKTNGLYAYCAGSVDVDAANSLVVNSENGNGISAWTGSANGQYIAGSGGKVNIKTGDLTVNATGIGLGANYMQSQITVNADGDVNIVAHGSDDTRAIHAGNSTTDPDITKENTSFVSVKAKNINLKADNIGVSAMSNGFVDLDGNVNIEARDAILARGAANVAVNKSGKNTVKMNGNIDFDYDKATSGSKVDAIVDVTLAGADSYWTGNTMASYGSGRAPDESYMKVNSISLTMKDGAVWNATKIVDNMNDDTSGSGYVAMNNLNINKGTVNIADTERGIIVENSTLADATFNGGPLNIKNMSLTGGTNTFNGNVAGVDSDSALTVASGATMNIGANKVTVDTVTLNGNLFALLREGDDGQITASSFDGTGKLNLTTNKEGTFRILDVETFGSNWSNEHISMANPVYKLTFLDDGFVKATKESVEDIAKNTGMEKESAVAISHIADAAAVSESKQLQELSVKMQEKLVENTPEAKAAVEHATKAIHPEKESVAQSVSTSVQNTVVNLASARMATPIVGRNGGDVAFTKGGVWAQGLFNKSKQNDAFNGYTRGIALGMDGTINKDWTIGAGYSYAHSDINGTARDTEIDSNTIFLYGQYKPAQWYVNAIANYTMSDYSERGTVLDGAVVTGDYDVDSFGGALAMGYDFANGITPELGLRYMHVNANDYANSYDINTHIDDTDFLTGVIGAKYAFNVVATRHLTLVPQLNAGVKYDLLSDKNTATVAMPGVNAYTIDGNRLKRIGGEFGIGLGMQYRELNVSVNYDIDVREDYTSQTGMLKFRYNF